MQSHDNTANAAISARNPQTPALDREARFAAGEGATTLGDHPFSLITCIRVSCASNAGKLEVGSHSWRSLFAPACPGNGLSLREWGYWYTSTVFYFDLTGGSQATIEAGWRSTLATKSVRACPQRTRPAPICSAQFRSLVKKRPQLGWELRDQAPLMDCQRPFETPLMDSQRPL
jgi:hypothetical protein